MSSGNVFLDLGFSPAEAEYLLLRSRLMLMVAEVLRTRNLTQAQAARLFGCLTAAGVGRRPRPRESVHH